MLLDAALRTTQRFGREPEYLRRRERVIQAPTEAATAFRLVRAQHDTKLLGIRTDSFLVGGRPVDI